MFDDGIQGFDGKSWTQMKLENNQPKIFEKFILN